MPKPPQLHPKISEMRGSIFQALVGRPGVAEAVPLHVGDSWRAPPDAVAQIQAHQRGLNRYSPPRGRPALLEEIAARNNVSTKEVVVTAGATGAFASIAQATLVDGDEVLVLSPFWPLIRGIITVAGARPIEVPFYLEDGPVADRLTPHLTNRTVAIYVNSPNNPTGAMLSRDECQEIAAFAQQHNLWIWSDEVYDQLAWGATHYPMHPFAPERTLTARSFSKTYAMAGYRCGYLTGPTQPISAALKVSTHQAYCAPSFAQEAALAALNHGDDWLTETVTSYRRALTQGAATLGVKGPPGGTFLFVDIAAVLDERGPLGFLERCLEAGFIVTPGDSCGSHYGSYIRICCTSTQPEQCQAALSQLATMLDPA